MYVLSLIKNLLLVSQILDNNMKVEFDIMYRENVFFIGDKSRNYQIIAKNQEVRNMFLLNVVASNSYILEYKKNDKFILIKYMNEK